MSARTSTSFASQSPTVASLASAAVISSRSHSVCANCSSSDSRRTRDSCAARRAWSIRCAPLRRAPRPGTALLELTQVALGVLGALACGVQITLELQAAIQGGLQARLQIQHGRVAIGELGRQASKRTVNWLRCSIRRAAVSRIDSWVERRLSWRISASRSAS